MDFHLPSSNATALEIPDIDFRSELNDEQFEAVAAEPGPLLILAGAGSGKTRTLTYRVAYLLFKGVPPRDILLLTFTNKAAKEMLERVEVLTGIEGKRFWGGTFHSIGHRLLRMHGETVGLRNGFTILDAGESESVLKSAVESIDSAFFKNKTHPKPSVLSNIISMARNTCLSMSEAVVTYFPIHQDFIEQIVSFAEAYEKAKREQNVVDYDDLLVLWLKLMDEQPEIAQIYQARFRHTLVDEYQDTNILQARIVDSIAANHQIMAVGDDAQCIYSWRGANFENIINFSDRHEGTRMLRIETNYRSTKPILDLANAVIENRASNRGFDKSLRADKEDGQKPFIVQAMDGKEQAIFIINRLQGLIDEGQDPSEIAILYRAHYHALDIQMELSRAGIPYQITSGVRFFEQAHIKDMVAHLRFVFNPEDYTAFERLFLLLPKVGPKSTKKLYQLAKETAKSKQIDLVDAVGSETILKRAPKAAREDWESLAISLRDMKQVALSGAPDEVVQMAIDGWYSLYLQGAYANFNARMDDIKSLVGFASRYEDMHELISQIVLLSTEIPDKSAEDSTQAIRLTTIHQAKGLEFNVVFMIGLADGFFPTRRAIEDGDTEEERRLFYVGVTRARDELYLMYPKVNSKGGGPSTLLSPSRFLQELPKDLYEPVRIRRAYGW